MPAPKPKAPGRPFQPGQSGNPGGKWKSVAEFKELLKGDLQLARRELLKALQRPGETVGAASLLFQYVLGRPASNVNLRIINGYDDLSDEELLRLAGREPPMIEGSAAEEPE